MILYWTHILHFYFYYILHIFYFFDYPIFQDGKINVKYYSNQLERIMLEDYSSVYLKVTLSQRPPQPCV